MQVFFPRPFVLLGERKNLHACACGWSYWHEESIFLLIQSRPKVGGYLVSFVWFFYNSLITSTNPTIAMAVQSICIPIGEDPSAPDDAVPDDEVEEVVLLPPPLLDDVDELSATPPTPVVLRHLSFPRTLASELNSMSAHWGGRTCQQYVCLLCA